MYNDCARLQDGSQQRRTYGFVYNESDIFKTFSKHFQNMHDLYIYIHNECAHVGLSVHAPEVIHTYSDHNSINMDTYMVQCHHIIVYHAQSDSIRYIVLDLDLSIQFND